MATNSVERRLVIMVKVMHSIFLATVPVAALVVALLPKLGWSPVFDGGDPVLSMIEAIMGGASLLCLATGLSWPWLARWHKTVPRADRDVVYGHVLRVSFLETVVIYGLSLGFMGSGWYVLAPIFVSAGVALVLTFPTNRRLAKMLFRLSA